MEDSNLQIFLTIYHGSLMGTFLYDYIIRNTVRIFEFGVFWPYVSNIAMGVLFMLIIIWAILSVWRKIKQNLLISLIALIVIFVVRLGVGIPEHLTRPTSLPKAQYLEEMTVFIAQLVVHLSGIIATWILFSNSPNRINSTFSQTMI